MVKVKNKIDEVSFLGGLIGWLTVNPRATIEKRIDLANASGWRLVQLESSSGTNALIAFLRFLVLVITLGLLTFGDGVYLIFEKEVE